MKKTKKKSRSSRTKRAAGKKRRSYIKKKMKGGSDTEATTAKPATLAEVIAENWKNDNDQKERFKSEISEKAEAHLEGIKQMVKNDVTQRQIKLGDKEKIKTYKKLLTPAFRESLIRKGEGPVDFDGPSALLEFDIKVENAVNAFIEEIKV